MTQFPQLASESAKTQVTLHTNQGDIQIALFDDLVPKTVKNFVELAKEGYYNDVIFHRVIKDFMIQGGDPSGTGMGGRSIYGEKFEDEFVDNLFHLRGALSMANAGPDTNGSQFFIVTANQVPSRMLAQMQGEELYSDAVIAGYAKQGGTPWLDQRHTVFGQVVSGMNVVDHIQEAQTDFQDRPLEKVYIQQITVQEG